MVKGLGAKPPNPAANFAYDRHIQTRQRARDTRSSATPALLEPFTNYAQRAFHCSAPAVCNSLPKTVLDCVTLSAFKSKLKTFLFCSHIYIQQFFTVTCRQRFLSCDLKRYINVIIIIINNALCWSLKHRGATRRNRHGDVNVTDLTSRDVMMTSAE